MAVDETQGLRPLALSSIISVVAFVVYFIVKGFNARKSFNSLRKQNLPTAGWSWFFGSLIDLKKHLEKLPVDADEQYAFAEMALTAGKGGIYVDLWPVEKPILVLTNPILAAQAREVLTEPIRAVNSNTHIDRITGGPTILTLPNKNWKQWRAIFNPGFSTAALTDQVPEIVNVAKVFVEKLRAYAKEDRIVQLEEDVLRLALDVIGIVTLDVEFDYQRNHHPIPAHLRAMINNTSMKLEMTPIRLLNPIPRLLLAYHDRKLRQEIDAALDACFARRRAGIRNGKAAKRTRTIIDLALDAYLEANSRADGATTELDPTFKHYAASHLRLFLFAGHDTTASAIIYAYNLLSQHQSHLTRLRAEHDAIFGADDPASRLAAEPALLNQLPYTTACMKETLRLYPPTPTTRVAQAPVVLTDADGTRYPVGHGTTVLNLSFAIHRNPRVWGADAEMFDPERWLDAGRMPEVKGAWLPFELGARNCVGQQLAMMEIKIVLAMTARGFDVVPAYAEWDEMNLWNEAKVARGERAYAVRDTGGGTHAADMFPCRVKVRGV